MSDEKRMDTALLAENDENTAAEENALVMKLDKPFTFEGQTYTEVDLSGLEDTTAADLQAVGRFVTKKNPAANPATVEMTLEYAQFMAARVAHLPLEFFERLPAKEAIKLKGIVVGFFTAGLGTTNARRYKQGLRRVVHTTADRAGLSSGPVRFGLERTGGHGDAVRGGGGKTWPAKIKRMS